MKLLCDDPDRRYQDLREVLIEIGKLRIEAPEEIAQVLFGSREMRRIDEGISAMREGRMPVARQVAAEFEAHTPEGFEAEAQYLVGLIHVSDGRPDLAGKSFERALYHDDENLDITLDYAMMLLRQGELDQASMMLDRVSGAFRGNLLVLGLLDTIEQLRRAPPEVRAHVGNKLKKDGNLLGSLRSFFKRSG